MDTGAIVSGGSEMSERKPGATNTQGFAPQMREPVGSGPADPAWVEVPVREGNPTELDELHRVSRQSAAHIRRVEEQNAKLVEALEDAKQNIQLLQDEVESLCTPPNSYATFVRANKDDTAEVLVDARPMRVGMGRSFDPNDVEEGSLIRVNESFVAIEPAGYAPRGEVASVVDHLPNGRIIVTGSGDQERVVTLSEILRGEPIKVGDHLMIDPRSHYALEKMPKSSVEEVVLEEVPDVGYDDIGGMAEQIEVLRDSLELPYLHPEIFAEHHLKPPKGILLYGPPGCGKTLVAKAVANSLAKGVEERTGNETTAYFLNVKGPELLNKYVGETEHKLREVFKKAREKASHDVPVVIFFDEMDSLFRMRGSGVSSDMEATVVAQFLSEIDGVESLENVIVMGASNRQDLIDPAVLRPGRLDLKVKVSRPDEESAIEIFSKYLTPQLPLHKNTLAEYDGDAEAACRGLIQGLVEEMYSTGEENRFLEVTYGKGEREVFYFKDFASGAMIANIVDRAKRMAVKSVLSGGDRGIRLAHLLAAVRDEFKESEDLPNTTNPDDWARISGKKGERITNVRTLIEAKTIEKPDTEDVPGQGQYL
jgi:proteasome-associated ATPase